MEQAPPAPHAPGQPPQPAQQPGAPSPAGEQNAAGPTFPDATGSLSSILASLSGATSESATAPDTPDPPQTPRKAPRKQAPSSSTEPDNPYPEIMLMPLPRQDALRIKWGLGNGLPNVSTLTDNELQLLATSADIPKKSGSLRLYGMLPSGEPWEARLAFEDLEKAKDGIIIGRDPSECGIVIGADSVSRKHAVLEMTEDGMAITDLGSRNGTTVDDQPITRYDRRVPLNDGSTISLGEVTIRLEILLP